jgi:hypothetical protein
VPPSSGSIIPRTLLWILKTEDAGITFFEKSVNIYNLVWHTLSEDVNLNVSFVWICHMWWNFKQEALDHTQWRTYFERGYGPVIRHTKQWMNEWMKVILYSTWGSNWQFFLLVFLAIIPMKAGGMAITKQPNVETTDKIWALRVVLIENTLWK